MPNSIAELVDILTVAKEMDLGTRYYLSCLPPDRDGWPLRVSFPAIRGRDGGELAVIHKPEPWLANELHCDGIQLLWKTDFYVTKLDSGQRIMVANGIPGRRNWDRPLYRSWLHAWEEILNLGRVDHQGRLGFECGT